MKIDDYRNGARRLTDEHCTTPAQTVRNWAASWRNILRLLIEGRVEANGEHIGRGIFEPCSLIIARWEFLGTLLTGHDGRSNRVQALAYANAFLVPVNGRYGASHPTIAPGWTVAQLLVQMMRNGSLHGFTPSGVYDDTTDCCLAWAVGYELPDRSRHLHFDGGHLLIDGGLLLDEFVESMDRFAAYLDENQVATNGKLPTENFREGYRWRLFPAKANDNGVPPPWAF